VALLAMDPTDQLDQYEWQGLSLVHFSAQPEPFLPLKPLHPPNVSHEKRSRQAEKCTSVSP